MPFNELHDVPADTEVGANAFEFGDILGQGKQANVSSATFTQFGTEVAIKQFINVETLQIELRALKATSPHPNVMRCFGSNLDERFIVLERLCLSLRSHCQNRMWKTPFPAVAEPVDLLHGICSGLAHCHSHDVVHRDLTIDNVLLRNTGTQFVAVISDFGVSGILGDATSTPRGSLRHYAPEAVKMEPTETLACGGYYTQKADVYMFGTLMYEMAFAHETGKKGAFFAELYRVPDVIAAVKHRDRPALDKFISPYADIVKQAWHQLPSKRPLASHLVTWLADLRLTSCQKALPPWKQSQSSSHHSQWHRKRPRYG